MSDVKITTFRGGAFRRQVIDECLRTSVKDVWPTLKKLRTEGKISGAMDNPFDSMKKVGKTDAHYLLKVYNIIAGRREGDPTKNKHVLEQTIRKLRINHGFKDEAAIRVAAKDPELFKSKKGATYRVDVPEGRTSTGEKTGRAKAKVVKFKPDEAKEVETVSREEVKKAAAAGWGAPAIAE